ncbi:MAG: holo-ACP synthase [Sphingobacteriales bacterium]|nr:holo-ACP synthase [Sphingobacteriales bacterium]
MIAGIGIDITEVERIANSIGKEKGFREVIFSKNEIAYCEAKTNKFEHYAARFAAKEAFFKALGTGWMAGTAFNEIEITNEENGKPVINLLAATASTVKEKMGDIIVTVSLTHIKTFASAVVTIEK